MVPILLITHTELILPNRIRMAQILLNKICMVPILLNNIRMGLIFLNKIRMGLIRLSRVLLAPLRFSKIRMVPILRWEDKEPSQHNNSTVPIHGEPSLVLARLFPLINQSIPWQVL
jgi:hypothetical protein